MTERLAVLLCGHGTRHADGADEFRRVAAAVRERLPEYDVGYAFLELSEPLLPAALADLAAKGHRKIVVIPCMLFAAGHAKSDIPGMIRHFEAAHPEVEVIYGRTFGVDDHLLEAAETRISSVLDGVVPPSESLLLVIGRGCSDFGANADLVKMMRLLWEHLGFGWGEVGFFDVTFPHLEVAIDHAARLGYRRIVVFPYLLFTGVLVRRLRQTLDEARRRYPALEFVEAPYFNDHPGVIDVFTDRVVEAAEVEIDGDHDHDHDDDDDDDDHDHHHDHHHHHHDHGDGHGHHHHHGSRHPFADHPNGPQSPRRWGL